MLLFEKRFFPFFSTFFFGAFNDNMLRNAFVIFVTYQCGIDSNTASALAFIAMALLMVPQFFFSSIAGEIADKYPQRKLFIWTKLAEAVLMSLAMIAFFYKAVICLLVLIFLMGTQSAFYSPVKYAYIPRNVPDQIVYANVLVNAGTYLAILLGTIGGIQFISVECKAYVDFGLLLTGSVLVLIAIFGLVAAFGVPDTKPVAPNLKLNWNLATGTWDILKIAHKDKNLWISIVGQSIFWMAGSLYISQMAVFCKEVVGANENVVTAFNLLFSVGVGIGSYLCAAYRKFGNVFKAVSPALILMGLFTLDLFLASQHWNHPELKGAGLNELVHDPLFWRMAADMLLLSACGGFYSVPLATLMQVTAKPEEMARVVGANNIANAAMIAIGSVASSQLTKHGIVSVNGVFLVIAVINILAAVYLFPLRKLKTI